MKCATCPAEFTEPATIIPIAYYEYPITVYRNVGICLRCADLIRRANERAGLPAKESHERAMV